ncbi:MAG TPA: hypothetical protein VNY31_01655 [Solirubrobacteraceae bacterium]|jgi:hypothetical protein|nr:hypothetical protein [Solirubrobacteraceae bacterium]
MLVRHADPARDARACAAIYAPYVRCLKPGGRLIGTTFLAGENGVPEPCSESAPARAIRCRRRAKTWFAG